MTGKYGFSDLSVWVTWVTCSLLSSEIDTGNCRKKQRPIQWTRIAVRFMSKSRCGKPTEKGNDYGTTVPFVGDWPTKAGKPSGFWMVWACAKHIFKIEPIEPIWTCVCVCVLSTYIAGVTGDASKASPGCKQSYLQGTGYNNLVSSGWRFVARNCYSFPYYKMCIM